jgi:signal transduction histidine kinase
MNLLINAYQSISGKGEIRISTVLIDHQVRISISDTGSGIRKEHLDRVFDPGFTTKGVGVGTGLGLSISARIIQDHNGTISVESEVGKGSTFTILLPTNHDAARITPPMSSFPAPEA